ncbi:MAG: agmatine deiminase family protein [Gemmatimonadota bacterium]
MTPMGVGMSASERWTMPEEGAVHRRTWMTFPSGREVWGRDIGAVQEALSLIARTISRFEPVRMLAAPQDHDAVRALCGDRVEIATGHVDDLWVRDTGPTFAWTASGELGAVDLNFNGWGEKQSHARDARVAAAIAALAGARHRRSALIAEGGGIEVDGQGTAIVTESCVLNDNRNPGMSKGECERHLREELGIEKVIWLPGIEGHDITDGHTDFYARFASPGVVVAALEPDPNLFDYEVTREHLALLREATDARGASLAVHTLEAPHSIRGAYASDDFAAGYVNYYVVNGAVIAPEFGDRRRDDACRTLLGALYPGRSVEMLNIDVVAAGGGGIHCTTQQEPQPA